MHTYTRETRVKVQPFTRQQEGGDVIIGRVETGVFLAVPAEAVELLEQLADGRSVGEATDLYQQKYGETPDVDDFLQYLEVKGIVTSANGIEMRPATAPSSDVRQARKVRYHFANFPQVLAQRLFGRKVLLGSLALFVLALGLVISDPSLVPRPRDLYFPDHRTLSWIILIVLGYSALFVHELGHLIAARAVGVNSRMGISHRLWYLVAETDLTAMWSVPKQHRYLPLFAGTIIDVVSGCLLIMVLFAHARGWLAFPVFAERVIRAMTFTYVMRIIWQCLLFVRTDFYYVIASLFNCRSLLRDTENFLCNLLARFLPWIRKADQSAIPYGEWRVIRVYSVLWVLGRIVALYLLSVITVPLFIRYSRSLAGAIRAGYSANPENYIDAWVFTFYFLMPVALGLTLWIRSLVRSERS